MEKKMNVAATFRLREVNVAAGLQPTKWKGHSEQPCSESCFGAYSLEESRAIALEESSTSRIASSQRRFSPLTKGESERDFLKSESHQKSSPEMGGNFSSYQEGQGEVSSTSLLSGEAGRGYESATATPEFIPQNGTQTIYFYHWDHLGTVRMVTNSSGAVVSRHDFEPYGIEIPPYNDTASNTHKFTGQERDASTGYDYMHARFYGSVIGRFMSVDKIGLDRKRLYNPQRWNRYVYASNSPVLRFDPNGLSDIVYDASTNMIYLYDSRGSLVTYDRASNNAQQSSRGRWENGTYEALDKTSPHLHGPRESTGPEDTPSGSYGPNGIVRAVPFVQSDGQERTGMGIHSGRGDEVDRAGRSDVDYATNGCVRTTTCMMDAIVDTMAVDPLQTITIQNNPAGPEPSPEPSLSTIEDSKDCPGDAPDPALMPSPTYVPDEPEENTKTPVG